MGFSISGSAAIIFVGMFIALGLFYTASANSYERVSDAQAAQSDGVIDRKNTNVTVVNTSYDDGADTLFVKLNNTGSEPLVVDRIDVLVDGAYQTTVASSSVDGADTTPTTDTDLLAPGERLTFEIDATSRPGRVKVVTGPGISAFSDSVVLL